MNIVIFGLGEHYKKNKSKINGFSNLNIVALSDNNSLLWGKMVDNVEVLQPEKLQNIEFDYVVITSRLYMKSIKEQLLSYGIPDKKIMSVDVFLKFIEHGDLQVFFPRTLFDATQKRILFVSTDLAYNGGSLAIIYAALASKKIGFFPVILVPSADVNLVDEYIREGICFLVYPNLCNVKIEELFWLNGYSHYIVNAFRMMPCANELAKKYSVIWWLHETRLSYEVSKDLLKKYDKEALSKLNIYAVTERAKINFEEVISGVQPKELLLGIPDTLQKATMADAGKEKLIFAVVGGISNIKGQDLLLEALTHEKLLENKNIEFWFIGHIPNDDYAQRILTEVKKYPQVKVIGKKTRKEMEQLYHQIDVLVVCSREETLSVVAIEAMMYKKACIVSDACGIMDYLENELTELVYPWADTKQLAKRISWCIKNREQLPKIGEMGRDIYECKFSMNAFEGRLKCLLQRREEE